MLSQYKKICNEVEILFLLSKGQRFHAHQAALGVFMVWLGVPNKIDYLIWFDLGYPV